MSCFTEWILVRARLEGAQQELMVSLYIENPPFQQTSEVANGQIRNEQLSSKCAVPGFSRRQFLGKNEISLHLSLTFCSRIAPTPIEDASTAKHIWLPATILPLSFFKCCYCKGRQNYVTIFYICQNACERFYHLRTLGQEPSVKIYICLKIVSASSSCLAQENFQ